MLLLVALAGCDSDETAPGQAQVTAPPPAQAAEVTTPSAVPAEPTQPVDQRTVVLHVAGMKKSKGDAT